LIQVLVSLSLSYVVGVDRTLGFILVFMNCLLRGC